MSRPRKPSSLLHLVEPNPAATPAPLPSPAKPVEPPTAGLGQFEGKVLVKIADAAAALKVSRATVYRENARGRLAFVHVGSAVRIRVEALKSYIDAHETLGAEGARMSAPGPAVP